MVDFSVLCSRTTCGCAVVFCLVLGWVTQIVKQNLNDRRRTTGSSGTEALNGRNFNLSSSDNSSNLDLNHQRIELGQTIDECACVAAPCHRNGNVMTFSNARNLEGKQRIELVKQIANALEGLHRQDIIHGNIYPGNIAITDDETVVLKNAGVFTGVIKLLMLYPSSRVHLPQSAAYKPPEELRGDDDGMIEPTKSMDVYAFGSTIYEIMTSRRPFFETSNLCQVFVKITLGGGHTSLLKPAAISPSLWRIMQKCWSPKPAERPTMREVVGHLQRLEDIADSH